MQWQCVLNRTLLRVFQQAHGICYSSELLASCQGNCSRQACLPVQGDDEGYECKRVTNNSHCYSVDGNLGCRNIRVSMAKSFVRYHFIHDHSTNLNVTLHVGNIHQDLFSENSLELILCDSKSFIGGLESP